MDDRVGLNDKPLSSIMDTDAPQWNADKCRGELPLHAPISHDTNPPRPRRHLQVLLVVILLVSLLHRDIIYRWYNDGDSMTRNPAYLIEAKHGAVASEHVRCSNMGVDVLKEGGNAVDAAIITTLCVGTVNMFS